MQLSAVSVWLKQKKMQVGDARHGPSYHRSYNQGGNGYRAKYISWLVLKQMRFALPGHSLRGLKQEESYRSDCTRSAIRDGTESQGNALTTQHEHKLTMM